jgi:steroid delta-isomerase-like uncharacterized protein
MLKRRVAFAEVEGGVGGRGAVLARTSSKHPTTDSNVEGQRMSQATQDVEQLVREYVELWNEQAYSDISDVVSDSFVHETPAAPEGEARGHDGLEMFMREITSGFPDFEATIVDIIVSEDRAMVETEFTMTHEGEFNGIPPTGAEVEIRSLANVRAADGDLQELREYLNQQEFLEQLGLTEA